VDDGKKRMGGRAELQICGVATKLGIRLGLGTVLGDGQSKKKL